MKFICGPKNRYKTGSTGHIIHSGIQFQLYSVDLKDDKNNRSLLRGAIRHSGEFCWCARDLSWVFSASKQLHKMIGIENSWGESDRFSPSQFIWKSCPEALRKPLLNGCCLWFEYVLSAVCLMKHVGFYIYTFLLRSFILEVFLPDFVPTKGDAIIKGAHLIHAKFH